MKITDGQDFTENSAGIAKERLRNEIECCLLGTLFAFPDAIATMDYSGESIINPDHRIMFSEMRKQYAENKSFSPESVAARMKSDDPAYCKHLTMMALTPLNIPEYCALLDESHRCRKLVEAAYTLIAKDNAGATSADLQTEIAQALSESSEAQKVVPQKTVKRDIINNLTNPRNCYSTGINGLDDILGGGLFSGYTYGFCGAEKAGKTTLAHTISYAMKDPHLYVAMEMGAEQIEQRNYARDMKINSLEFLKNNKKLSGMIEEEGKERPVFYLDAPGQTLDEILFNVGAAKAKHGITGFILDYWQLVSGHDNRSTEEKHLRDVAQNTANFARKNGLWCIILAQMNKDGGLFGGNGLRKACDMLVMIEKADEVISKHGRWLRMDASRYTMLRDYGSASFPSLWLNNKSGPYFQELDRNVQSEF